MEPWSTFRHSSRDPWTAEKAECTRRFIVAVVITTAPTTSCSFRKKKMVWDQKDGNDETRSARGSVVTAVSRLLASKSSKCRRPVSAWFNSLEITAVGATPCTWQVSGSRCGDGIGIHRILHGCIPHITGGWLGGFRP